MTTGLCHCGCGTPVDRHWAQGHDARAMYRTIRENYPSHDAFLSQHNAKGAPSTVVVAEYGSVREFVAAHTKPDVDEAVQTPTEQLSEVEAALARWVDEEIATTSSPRWMQGHGTPEEIARVAELWEKQDNPRAALEAERAAEARAEWEANEAARKARLAEQERREAQDRVRREMETRRLRQQREDVEVRRKEHQKKARKARKAAERKRRQQDWDYARLATVFVRVPVAVLAMVLVIVEISTNSGSGGAAMIVGAWVAVLALTLFARNEVSRIIGWITLAAPFAFFLIGFVILALLGLAGGGKK